MPASTCFLGADLGGTQLRLAPVARDGRLAGEVLSAPTGRGFGPDDLRRVLPELVARARGALQRPLAGTLGFGTPGVVGPGPLAQCDNLPLLNGVEMAGLIQDALGVPVAIENDARCFALAETLYGAARGAQHVCGITLGTGVGCGLIVAGRLHRGAAGQAGEIWSLPRRARHLEHYLSGEGLIRAYAAAGGEPGLDPAGIEARARAGNEAATSAWRSFGEDLAFLCRCVLAFHDPEVIVIGGSLSGAHDLYAPALAAHLGARQARIVTSRLGMAAGLIGAASLAMDGHSSPDRSPGRGSFP
jgi:glucokinase